ncbi:hypothetical protein PMAYCL1PPCAC_32351, partial [Pristionchus mayeri]
GRRLVPRLFINQLNIQLSQNIANQQSHRFLTASSAVSTKGDTNQFFVRCRGIPLSVKENEVSAFLGGKGIKRVDLKQLSIGEAVIECEDEE